MIQLRPNYFCRILITFRSWEEISKIFLALWFNIISKEAPLQVKFFPHSPTCAKVWGRHPLYGWVTQGVDSDSGHWWVSRRPQRLGSGFGSFLITDCCSQWPEWTCDTSKGRGGGEAAKSFIWQPRQLRYGLISGNTAPHSSPSSSFPSLPSSSWHLLTLFSPSLFSSPSSSSLPFLCPFSLRPSHPPQLPAVKTHTPSLLP